MNSYRNDICDMFPEHALKAVNLFCNEINNSNADVFVVMAHKAVLLLQILVDQNYISTDVINNKLLITNHALDFNCNYLKGKRVAIIDDIVISGTSIATVVNKLLDIGIVQDDITIIALAIDKDYLSMSFKTTNGNSALQCNTRLEDATCIELSYIISKTFIYYGIPYDIDFPTYDIITINKEKMNLFFNNLFWETHEISNYNQDVGVKSYVLFPKKEVKNMLWKRIGMNMDNCTHLKIRLYIKYYPSGKMECNIIPLCLFNGITEKKLNELCDMFKLENNDLTFSEPNANVARMRYLQFVISHNLYHVFIDITSLCENTNPRKESIDILFGITDGTTVYKTLNYFGKNNSKIIDIEEVNCTDKELIDLYLKDEIYKKTIEKLKNQKASNKGKFLNRIMMLPFLWWYDNKELSVRNDLKMNPKHYINNFNEIKNMTNRLTSGFSLNTLKNILETGTSKSEIEIAISIFLDRASDEGIIVPTVYHNSKNHYLCRAYRHGEDLPFSIEDECRLLYFLKELCTLIQFTLKS